ncbi:MAG: hypothetical protein RIF32_10785 [Leptospirales bacterium]
MNNAAAPHSFFRPSILLVLTCRALQLLTGALLYLWKLGFHPARTIEYYFGSERMLELFPGSVDRFIQARSLTGMIKVTLGHLLAYGVLVFFLTHLARSIAAVPSRRMEWFCNAFFLAAMLEIVVGLALLLTPDTWIAGAPTLFAYGRAAVFVAFYSICAGFAAVVAYPALRPRAKLSDGDQAPRGPAAGGLKRGAALIIIALLPIAGCQSLLTGYSVESYEGPTESVVRMNNNYLGGAFALPGKLTIYSAQLNLQKTILNPENPASESVVSFYGRFFDLDYINIPAGETLHLELDGRSFRFEGLGSAKLRRPYSEDADEILIQEAAYWHNVPPRVLRALHNAETMRVRVSGEKRELSYFATDKNRSNFRRFIRDELPDVRGAAAQNR